MFTEDINFRYYIYFAMNSVAYFLLIILIILSLTDIQSISLELQRTLPLTTSVFTISQAKFLNSTAIAYLASNGIDLSEPLTIYNFQDKAKVLVPKPISQEIVSIYFDKQNNEILYGDKNSSITQYKIGQQRVDTNISASPAHIQILGVLKIGQTIFSVGSYGNLCKLENKFISCVLAHSFNSTLIHYIEPINMLLSTGGDKNLKFFKPNLELVRTKYIAGQNSMILAIDHSLSYIAFGDALGVCRVIQYDSNLGLNDLYTIKGSAKVSCLKIMEERNLLIIVFSDGKVKFWRLSNGNELHEDRVGDGVESCDWLENNLLSGHARGIARIWSVTHDIYE